MAYYNNECAFCGQHSGKYALCFECYKLSKDEVIIKDENGKWVENVKKGIEGRFYDPNKEYYLKEKILNEYEMYFFNLVRYTLKSKYVIIPQVNLQSIIETNNYTRNDELYRNVDFILFHAKTFTPFLVIELNGQQHYVNQYTIERDKSVKAILDRIQLPLLTIDIKTIKQMSQKDINNLMKKVIKYLNPSFWTRLLKKEINKMDLTWTKQYLY